ncbi:MAG: DegV family protein [Clostridiaceae bacterium]|nr:DegV family protein [Clostridiaceae bacterium]
MGIRIITDSICDVPNEYADRYGIRVMPLTVNFEDTSYIDGVDLTLEEFLKKLDTSEVLPTTSQVPPVDFLEAYKEEISLGNKVISIHASSQLSGTYSSAVIAKNQMPGADIHVIDTMGISLGAGLLGIKAARLAEEGMEAEEIVKQIEVSKQRMKYLLILDTLKYLQKGGRISLSASMLGSILSIKPILTVVNGKLEMLEKSRGMKKAISTVINKIKDNGWSLDGKVVGINHIVNLESREMLEEQLKKEFNIKEFIKGEAGSVIATHAGPGAIAVHFEM